MLQYWEAVSFGRGRWIRIEVISGALGEVVIDGHRVVQVRVVRVNLVSRGDDGVRDSESPGQFSTHNCKLGAKFTSLYCSKRWLDQGKGTRGNLVANQNPMIDAINDIIGGDVRNVMENNDIWFAILFRSSFCL
ncbi:hypothetical protein Tco_0758270 [Tanacetum coccineum]